MKENKKQYWNGLEQLTNDPEYVKYAGREFPQELPLHGDRTVNSSSRRDFLKVMGFSVAAASLAACEAPVRKAIPYLNKPEDIDPGIPNYYASTYFNGGEYCSIVVKTREGRPIKIQGNTLSPVSKGGTNAQVEASVLSLYDKERLAGPMIDGRKTEWEVIDKEILEKLEAIVAKGGQIRIISNTLISPTTQKVINQFIDKYPSTKHVTYDALSMSGIRTANKENFGESFIPNYNFAESQVIVSFSADFLGTWLNPIAFSRDYAKNRKISRDHRKMSRHYQFESNFSLTGANADYRIPIKPSSEGLVIAKLYNLIASAMGQETINIDDSFDVKFIEKAARDLLASRGSSLVVSASNDPDIQLMVNGINYMLGNYGKTIDVNNTLNVKQGDDDSMTSFIAELQAGEVDGVIFYNCNPVYNYPAGGNLQAGLEKVELTVSTSDRLDETSGIVKYIAPDHHFLESWNDFEPVRGSISLSQPTITPLFNTRQVQESLLKWSVNDAVDYFDYLKSSWQNTYYTLQNRDVDFQKFWDNCLHDGIIQYTPERQEYPGFDLDISGISDRLKPKYTADSGNTELALYTKVSIGDGTQANNPWLQEMPDPITKSTWDNYLTISQSQARELGLTTEGNSFSVVNLTIGDQTLKLPVLIQPGQAKGTVGLALGYGRKKAGRVANHIGVDAYPLISRKNGFQSYNLTDGIKIEPLSETYKIAQTQTHHTYMGRDNVIQEAYLEEFQADPSAGRHTHHIATSQKFDESVADGKVDNRVDPNEITLWEGHDYNNHHWGLLVDLNSCTGCSACTIACQVENNVPVVGKEEVLNRREMHWIRIDRYYSSDAEVNDFAGLEKAAENPEVTFQPMMCQHCNNAPCETVCPVAATTHSTEGLNQMVYNRCIGTRYCANNCPYKVRRFNWFKYHDNNQFSKNTSMNNDLGKMVLNPDVTVRSRGVMEKCSFCVQRIQYGKLEAKKEGRRPHDSDINVACAETCPSEALVFGDMNDPGSKISKMLRLKEKNGKMKIQEERAFHVLDEIGVRPNVIYFTKIRNKELEDKKA